MSRISLDQLDEFQGFLESVQDQQIIKWDETAENFVPVDHPVFGNNFGYEFTDVDVSTNLIAFQTYMDITTPVLPAGTYLFFVQVAWRTANAQSLLELTVLQDGVDMFSEHQVESSASTRDEVRKYVNGEGLFVVSADAAVNFKLQYKRVGAVGTIYLFSGYMRWFRIS